MGDGRVAYLYLAVPPDAAFHARQGRSTEGGPQQHVEIGEKPRPDAPQLAALLVQRSPFAMAHAGRAERRGNPLRAPARPLAPASAPLQRRFGSRCSAQTTG